jgi:hypothetical protein
MPCGVPGAEGVFAVSAAFDEPGGAPGAALPAASAGPDIAPFFADVADSPVGDADALGVFVLAAGPSDQDLPPIFPVASAAGFDAPPLHPKATTRQ